MVVEKIERKMIFEKEIIEELRKYSIETTGNEKRLSETMNNILREYFKNLKEKDTRIPVQTPRTQRRGSIDEILDYIEENNPTGITKKEIERAIKDMRGYDSRTVNKYEPIILEKLEEQGYKQHPRNTALFVKYDINK